MGPILLILLILLCVGGLPQLGWNTSYGWGPSGIGGVLLIVVLILLLTGRL